MCSTILSFLKKNSLCNFWKILDDNYQWAIQKMGAVVKSSTWISRGNHSCKHHPLAAGLEQTLESRRCVNPFWGRTESEPGRHRGQNQPVNQSHVIASSRASFCRTLRDTTGKGLERRARSCQPLHKWWFSNFPDGGTERLRVQKSLSDGWGQWCWWRANELNTRASVCLLVFLERSATSWYSTAFQETVPVDTATQSDFSLRVLNQSRGAEPGPQCCLLLKWLAGDPTNPNLQF